MWYVCVCAGVVGGGGANHTRSFSNVLYAKNSAIFAEKSALLKLLSFFSKNITSIDCVSTVKHE